MLEYENSCAMKKALSCYRCDVGSKLSMMEVVNTLF